MMLTVQFPDELIERMRMQRCSNHGCVFGDQRGWGTAGACHCLDDLRREPTKRALVREVMRAVAMQSTTAAAAGREGER